MIENQLVICRGEYESQEKFENAIRDAVMLLIHNNYILTVEYDDKGLGIIVINYNYADRDYGAKYPYWLSLKEWESVRWGSEE